MRKGSSILGKNVLSLATGERLHSVSDVIINQDNDDIVALVLQEGGLLSSTLVVPIEGVSSFGKDAVVVPDAASVGRASDFPEIQPLIEHRGRITGRKVFTESGEDHGSIKDMYFDEATGRVLGFEITGGAFADVAGGTSFVSTQDIVRTGPDVVYVTAEAVAKMDAQKGGLAGAVEGAAGKLKEATRSGAGGDAGSPDQPKAPQPPEQAVIGRRAGSEITDENGSIVVARGQVITAEHVERARATNNLSVLLDSAGVPRDGGSSDDNGQRVGDAAQAAGDKAGGLWDSFTRKISEMTDATGKRMDERDTKKRLQDIEDAVGRPVTKVILDRQDNVVLNLGDIITHEAVQRAYDAGALDSLLGSVYKGDVHFERDEMRAPMAGEATVEKASGDAPIVDELTQKVQTAEQDREAQKQQKREQADAERQQREQQREAKAGERDQRAQERDRVGAASYDEPVKGAEAAAGSDLDPGSEPMAELPAGVEPIQLPATTDTPTRVTKPNNK